MDGTLTAHEPASGPLENILQVPGLGALSANVSIAGPHNAEQIDVELSAGELKAQVRGSVDLSTGSAALDYSVTAPQVSPRPDLKWQKLALDGHWKGAYTDPTADAHLEIERLVLPAGSAIANLHAELNAAGGDVALKGDGAGTAHSRLRTRAPRERPAQDRRLHADQGSDAAAHRWRPLTGCSR